MLSSQKREAVEGPLMRGRHSPRRQRDVERAAASQRAPQMTESSGRGRLLQQQLNKFTQTARVEVNAAAELLRHRLSYHNCQIRTAGWSPRSGPQSTTVLTEPAITNMINSYNTQRMTRSLHACVCTQGFMLVSSGHPAAAFFKLSHPLTMAESK